jgi:hypothetical protein
MKIWIQKQLEIDYNFFVAYNQISGAKRWGRNFILYQ